HPHRSVPARPHEPDLLNTHFSTNPPSSPRPVPPPARETLHIKTLSANSFVDAHQPACNAQASLVKLNVLLQQELNIKCFLATACAKRQPLCKPHQHVRCLLLLGYPTKQTMKT
ncbi:hypothetical protein PTTG_25550, partial [Puccinia triticina 1-1 BBBD Race 1]|uniref:Uncharacterized protein n=1 Tax=Puccinia triticina (isolate 1-1 / race 1 (BBBD)) TaxID=630390 RepID=A0A0C4FDY4_PUCT1